MPRQIYNFDDYEAGMLPPPWQFTALVDFNDTPLFSNGVGGVENAPNTPEWSSACVDSPVKRGAYTIKIAQTSDSEQLWTYIAVQTRNSNLNKITVSPLYPWGEVD